MTVVNFPYIDAEIEQMADGAAPPEHLRHFHWGLFDNPSDGDDSTERYVAAATSLTEHILGAAGVTDGLEPGGTLALSDFVLAPGALSSVTTSVHALGLGDWFGRSAAPLTSDGYVRLGRACGFELVLDDDVTARTLPTYQALRRLYREAGSPDGVETIDAVEQLAVAGGWQYHVVAFRRREGRR